MYHAVVHVFVREQLQYLVTEEVEFFVVVFCLSGAIGRRARDCEGDRALHTEMTQPKAWVFGCSERASVRVYKFLPTLTMVLCVIFMRALREKRENGAVFI